MIAVVKDDKPLMKEILHIYEGRVVFNEEKQEFDEDCSDKPHKHIFENFMQKEYRKCFERIP